MTAEQMYRKLRKDGVSHNMAEILAHRQCPGLRTGSTMLRNRKPYFGIDQDQKHTNAIQATAKRHGLDPANYCPTLADYAGDPKAFLPHDDPAGHVKRVERKRDALLAKAMNGD